MSGYGRWGARIIIAGILIVAVSALPAWAQTAAAPAARWAEKSGTWAAATSGGQRFGGSWTARADSTSGSIRGTWALLDLKGATLMTGAWSLAKERTGWSGSWRAIATGATLEYSGTWSSTTALPSQREFIDLMLAAVEKAQGGAWKTSGHSGSWSIRARP